MDAGNVVAAGAALLAAVVSIAIPVWTFKRTLQLDRIKWVRDQRAELYIDILTEAYAEKQWFLDEMTAHEIALIGVDGDDDERRPAPPATRDRRIPDLRLGPVERARLGSRQAIFAGEPVSRAYNAFNAELLRSSISRPRRDGDAQMAKVRAERLFADLEAAVRHEMSTTKLALPNPERPPAE